MVNKLRKDNEGFTIIEVLIVLAIAGLIMLIVFLAVPALQRNQRNTSRKNDVGRVGGAVSEFYSNNNGTTPSTAAHLATITDSVGNMNQYVATDLSIAAGAQAAVGSIDNMRIVTGAKCGAAGVTVAGTKRQIAIQYRYETSSGDTPLCTDV